jgi:hypothetical protein
MKPEGWIAISFLIVNVGTYLYVLARLDSKKGWLPVFPMFLVFGFVIAFIMIADFLENNNER